MPRGRTTTEAFTTGTTENLHILRVPENIRVDWEEVAAARPEPVDGEIRANAYDRPGLQLAIEEVSEEMRVHPAMSSGSRVGKLDLRTAIELALEQWSWIAETGSADEIEWPRWKSLLINSLNPLCEYAARKAKRYGSFSQCNYCPYKVYFQKRCDDAGRPYHNWRRSYEEYFANGFIKELAELRKQIILNPEKFR